MLEKTCGKIAINPFIGNFVQSEMMSPFSIDQQQLAMLSQQQSFLAAASVKSNGGSQSFPVNVHQPGSNGIHVPFQSWGVVGHQVPGMMMPIADQQKYVQVDLVKRF